MRRTAAALLTALRLTPMLLAALLAIAVAPSLLLTALTTTTTPSAASAVVVGVMKSPAAATALMTPGPAPLLATAVFEAAHVFDEVRAVVHDLRIVATTKRTTISIGAIAIRAIAVAPTVGAIAVRPIADIVGRLRVRGA